MSLSVKVTNEDKTKSVTVITYGTFITGVPDVVIGPGKSQDFVIHTGQNIRVTEIQVEDDPSV